MQTNDINLIKAQTEFSPELIRLEQRVRLVSYTVTGIFLFVGLLLGGTYFFLQARLAALKAQDEQLTASIRKSAVKEGLYITFKDRVEVVSRVVKLQTPLSGVLDSIRRIAPAGVTSAFALDEKNTVSTSISVSSVEDLMTFVANVLTETKNQRIKNPVLEGVTLEKGGTFKMTLSFTAIPQP